MSSQPTTFLTAEEYLERERLAEHRSEYYNGERFAMAGGSPKYAWIIGNVFGTLWQQLKGKPCRASSSDLRLRVTATGLHTYSDVMVICGDPQYADDHNDTVLNPILIVEVLSPSTRDYDLGKKFHHYRTLPSLLDYLTVAQDIQQIQQWTRQPEDRWLLTEINDPAQTIQLPSIGCTLPLSEVYDKIDFATGS
jgi:Uma2 family endonuclease